MGDLAIAIMVIHIVIFIILCSLFLVFRNFEKNIKTVYYFLGIYIFVIHAFSISLILMAVNENELLGVYSIGSVTILVGVMLLWGMMALVYYNKKLLISKYPCVVATVVSLVSIFLSIVFMIYEIPNDNNLQQIVLTLIAALLGGTLTLLGVAWSIKRQDDIRKEEEIAKNTPYLRKGEEDRKIKYKCLNERTIMFEVNYIDIIIFQNVADLAYVPLGYILNNEYEIFEHSQIIQNDENILVNSLIVDCSEMDFYLVVKNLKDNYFKYKVEFDFQWEKRQVKDGYGGYTEEETGEVKCVVKSIGLPELIINIKLLRIIKSNKTKEERDIEKEKKFKIIKMIWRKIVQCIKKLFNKKEK